MEELLETIPRLNFVNFVFAVNILPSDSPYRIPLHQAARLLPFVQYAPTIFAAAIFKLSSDDTMPTALVFAPGKIVIVTGISESDVILYSHLVRLIVSQIPFNAQERGISPENPNGPIIHNQTLEGITEYIEPKTHNIVASVDLGMELDLKRIQRDHVAGCKLHDDVFPGLKMDVWLNNEYKCICKRQRTQEEEEINKALKKKELKVSKCKCRIKVLCFKNGQLVFTGGRSTKDLQQAYLQTVLALVPKYVVSNTDGASAPETQARPSKTQSFEEAARHSCTYLANLKPRTFDLAALSSYKRTYSDFRTEGRDDLADWFESTANGGDCNAKQSKIVKTESKWFYFFSF